MHPLDLFDRFRRWFDWVAPGRQMWERKPEQVAPDRSDDWLLEPPSLEEARLLFPQLNEERALLRYQQLRLEMRERDGRGFSHPALGTAGALSQCASQLMYRYEQLSHN